MCGYRRANKIRGERIRKIIFMSADDETGNRKSEEEKETEEEMERLCGTRV